MKEYLNSITSDTKHLTDSEVKLTQIAAKLEAKEEIINKLLKDQSASRVEIT